MTDNIDDKLARQRQVLAEKKLKIWNGRGFRNYQTRIEYEHIFVCAKSMAEAVRLCKQAGYDNIGTYEIKNYWSKDAWGIPMLDVVPEPGVWGELKSREIVRLV